MLFHVTNLIPNALSGGGMLLITCLLISIALLIFTCILIGSRKAFKFVPNSVRANLPMKRKHIEITTASAIAQLAGESNEADHTNNPKIMDRIMAFCGDHLVFAPVLKSSSLLALLENTGEEHKAGTSALRWTQQSV